MTSLGNLPPEYVAALVEQTTREAAVRSKAINRKRYQRRYARIGRERAEGRKP